MSRECDGESNKNNIMHENLFSMRHEEISQHFHENYNSNHKSTGHILLTAEWTSGSVNDIVIKWIHSNGIPYLYYLEKLWFSVDGKTWSTFDYESSGSEVIVYERK